MRAGAYRLPVILQRPVETRATSGKVTRSFEVAGPAFAAVQLRSLTESLEGERLASRKSWEVRLRPVSGLAGGWRVIVGSRILRILSVSDPDGRGRQLVCDAVEESP